MQRLIAVFKPQEFDGNEFTNVLDEQGNVKVVTFDATEPLLRMNDFEINAFSDRDKKYLVERLPQSQLYNGPFEVEVDIDKWLNENGYKDRKSLSYDDLAEIRVKCGVEQPPALYSVIVVHSGNDPLGRPVGIDNAFFSTLTRHHKGKMARDLKPGEGGCTLIGCTVDAKVELSRRGAGSMDKRVVENITYSVTRVQ